MRALPVLVIGMTFVGCAPLYPAQIMQPSNSDASEVWCCSLFTARTPAVGRSAQNGPAFADAARCRQLVLLRQPCSPI